MLDMKNSHIRQAQCKQGFIALPVLIAIVVAVLAVGGGAYVYVQKNQANKPEVVKQVSEASAIVSTTTAITTGNPENTSPAQTSNTVNAKIPATGLKEQTVSLKLGNLFVTPQGTPTIQMPEGWKARVTDEDHPLKVQEKLTYITLVIFTNADHSRVFSYQLFASPQIIDESVGLDLAKEALSMDSNTTLISQKSVTLHGFPVSEALFRNVKKEVATDKPLVYEAVSRVFYIAPGFILVVGGSSTKEPASDILSWYNPIFESIVLPSFFNQYPNGIPIANFMNLKSKFDEMSNMANEAKAMQKGTPPDFFYSAACPTFTADMSLGDTDHNTGGQISLLQELLFGKYNVAGTITGRFDDITLVSTIRFQREMGLEGSGGVAEKTRAALARCRFSP